MAEIKQLIKKIIKFRNNRDWKQFHNPKDVAISLVLEATEILEFFQWKNKKEVEVFLKSNKNNVSDELADVLYWVLLMSNDLGIDIKKALEQKLKKNAKKYPIEKSKGKHNKYTEL